MLKLLIILALAGLAFAWWTGSSARRRGSMPVEEARALLGVTEEDDAETVRAAHRRLIARVHPDSGGTPELARRTNEARDVLLSELTHRRND